MGEFDNYFVAEVVDRLNRLQPDDRPLRDGTPSSRVVPRLIVALKYTMGRQGELPDHGNWFTRRVLGPLVLAGLAPFPIRWTNWMLDHLAPATEFGDVETLHAVLEEYVNLVQADELTPRKHPFFGDIGIDGWAAFHVRHFEHYLRLANV